MSGGSYVHFGWSELWTRRTDATLPHSTCRAKDGTDSRTVHLTRTNNVWFVSPLTGTGSYSKLGVWEIFLTVPGTVGTLFYGCVRRVGEGLRGGRGIMFGDAFLLSLLYGSWGGRCVYRPGGGRLG